MAEELVNSAVTTLYATCSPVQTEIVVADAEAFPDTPQFRILVDNELMLVTAIAGDTFTVSRGIEGTTAVSHAANATVTAVITAAGLIQAISDRITGAIGIATDSYSSTVTVNWTVSAPHMVTLEGNATIAFSNAQAGQRLMLLVAQDATGSRTVTWPAGVRWAGGVTPTLTTTPTKIDTFTFLALGGGKYLGFVVGKDFAP